VGRLPALFPSIWNFEAFYGGSGEGKEQGESEKKSGPKVRTA